MEGISMEKKHIAFFLEQAYGHIIPSLGITLELIRRGHRVSYAVTRDFAPAILRVGAQAVVIAPLETRPKILAQVVRQQGMAADGMAALKEIIRVKTEDSLVQLETLYCDDKPDLIIQDECEDVAGRSLASKWGIPQIRFFPALVTPQLENTFAEGQLVLVPVPRFFQKDPEHLGKRFKFIGFIAEGRKRIFEPWRVTCNRQNTILISVTTGLLPQLEFCKLVISAFRDQPWNIVLSIGGGFDRMSEIDPTHLTDLPKNFQLNRFSSNLDILGHVCLFVGQGGQGSTLEALYSGVPVLLVPPTYMQNPIACRIVELGLGIRLPADVSADSLRQHANSLLGDCNTLSRVRQAQESMHGERGAEVAANIIDEYLSRNS